MVGNFCISFGEIMEIYANVTYLQCISSIIAQGSTGSECIIQKGEGLTVL